MKTTNQSNDLAALAAEDAEALATPELAIDLSDEGLMAFVSRQPGLVRADLDAMERVEPWPADHGNDGVDALIAFAEALTVEDLVALAAEPPPELIEVLGAVRATRFLQIIERLMDLGEQTYEAKLILAAREACLEKAEAQRAFQICRARLLHIQKSRIMNRIFSPTRCAVINDALRRIALADGDIQ